MAAISSNNEAQGWKERAIRRAVFITDAWDVFNVYAGRLAAWVLFTCVILNVIEIMPFVHFSALVVGSIMGVQAITLDVAGNGMLALADHAREEGREADARSATTLGKWLIFIMIVTVGLVCVSTLWTPLAPYIAQAENGLILVRVVLTVVYLSVLKRLSRHGSPALSLSQVATLEQRMQSQVEAIAQAIRQMKGLTESVSAFQSPSLERQIESLAESVSAFQSDTIESLTETLQRVESVFQSQVTESISPIIETLDVHAEMLSVLPMLTQQIDAIGASTQLELRTVTEEFRQVRVTVEKQAQSLPRLAERVAQVVDAPMPVKTRLTLPAKRNEAVVSGDCDKKQFVFECLTENAKMTIAEMQRRATERGQSLSVGSASEYRKDFQNCFHLKVTESETESQTESDNQSETESTGLSD